MSAMGLSASHACAHAALNYMHVCTHAHLHTRTHFCLRACTHAHMLIYMQSYVCARTFTCMHAYVCVHTFIYTPVATQTPPPPPQLGALQKRLQLLPASLASLHLCPGLSGSFLAFHPPFVSQSKHLNVCFHGFRVGLEGLS